MKQKCLIIFLLSLLSACSSQPPQKSPNQRKAELYYQYGTQKLLAKDYPGALDNLIKARKLAPDDSQINNNLGMAYYLRGDRETAIMYTEKAIKLAPQDPDPHNNLASFYLEKGNLEKAKKHYQFVLKDLTYPKQYRTYYNLAVISLRENKLKKAEKFLKKSITINEDYCPAHYQLGVIYSKRNKISDALNSFVQGTKGTCYEQPAPHYQVAITLKKMKQYDGATQKLTDIIDRFPRTKYFSLASQQIQVINKMRQRSRHIRKYSPTHKNSSLRYNETDGGSLELNQLENPNNDEFNLENPSF